MNKKTKIIIISILLLIFTVVIIIIAINKNKPVEEDTTKTGNNYAINETREPTEEDEEEIEENKTVYVGDKEIVHLERLTPEQYTDKETFFTKLHNRVKLDETEDKKVVTEEISESSNESIVYVTVTFSDGTDETYVVTYDKTSMHSFLRCGTLEEYEYIQSGANSG